MKLFLVIASVIICSNGLTREFIDTWKSKLMEIGAKCAAETKATAKDISSVLTHKIPESHEGKCMILCFHKVLNIQKDDGTVDREGTLKALEPLKADDPDMYTKVIPILDTCEANTPVDADPCITAASLMICEKSELDKLGISAAELFEV